MEKQIQAVYSTPSQVTLVGEGRWRMTKVTIKKIRLNGISQTTSLMWSCHCCKRQHITTDKIQLTVELIDGPVQ